MLFRLLIPVTQIKKAAYNRKIVEIEKVIFDHNHYKYITTGKFNNLAKENFAAR